MNAKDALDSFKKQFGKKLSEARIEKVQNNAKKSSVERIWASIEHDSFKEAVKYLCTIHPMPHFVVISGYQIGDLIELIYHFSLNYAVRHGEFSFSIKTTLPKANAVLPTITDLIPGALVSEREVQEMLGVKISGIPDSRGLFLHKDFPKGVFPWRRDETGPEKLVKNTHKGERK
ncbi:MAG: NADH-quinone oxidoreductase subunit C [Candidatus Diapherotrites archaeon]|nr:NADH-quinone oxidoreductase subunit C [Candidatus Diapherotrites archaeon]